MEERVSGPNSQQALDAKMNMAAIIRHQGKHDEAMNLQREVLAKETSILGAEHPSTVSTLTELGLTYMEIGPLGRSEQLIAQAVQLHLKASVTESPRAL